MKDSSGPKLRCLQITGDPVGGIRLHVHTLIRELLIRHIFVCYACSNLADTLGTKEIDEFIQKKVPLIRRPIQKLPAISDVINVFHLVRFAKRNQVNLIHGHGAKGGLYARVIGLLLGVRVIYTPHGGVVHASFSPFSTWLYATIESALFLITYMYIFESRYTKTQFQKLIKKVEIKKSIVNHNGIDTSKSPPEFHSTIFGAHLRLIVIGMLRREKGQEIMIQAAQILKNRGIYFDLIFCGDGPERTSLESLSVALGVSNQISFLGDVEDVRPFLSTASIVVIPSNFESFGYVALEAAQAGIPVVASGVGGLCEVIQNGVTGLLFKAGDPVDLANKIYMLIQNPTQAHSFVKAAYKRCNDVFSVHNMVANLLTVYGNAI